MNKERKLLPIYIGRIPITGRYYGNEFEKTLEAAQALKRKGFLTYPDSNPEQLRLISENGDIFNFVGGNVLTNPPFEIQLGFFRAVKETPTNVQGGGFCYVAIQNGYLGRTASLEVAYAMANSVKTIFSEPPISFSPEISESIRAIINDNYSRYPVVPVERISQDLEKALATDIHHPFIESEQRKELFFTINSLIRDLRNKFGSKVNSNPITDQP